MNIRLIGLQLGLIKNAMMAANFVNPGLKAVTKAVGRGGRGAAKVITKRKIPAKPAPVPVKSPKPRKPRAPRTSTPTPAATTTPTATTTPAATTAATTPASLNPAAAPTGGSNARDILGRLTTGGLMGVGGLSLGQIMANKDQKENAPTSATSSSTPESSSTISPSAPMAPSAITTPVEPTVNSPVSTPSTTNIFDSTTAGGLTAEDRTRGQDIAAQAAAPAMPLSQVKAPEIIRPIAPAPVLSPEQAAYQQYKGDPQIERNRAITAPIRARQQQDNLAARQASLDRLQALYGTNRNAPAPRLRV